MKKTYKLRDLDCANCAAKMEANIKEVELDEIKEESGKNGNQEKT